MFEKFISFFMTFLIFFFNLFSPPLPDAKNPEEIKNLSDLCEEFPVGETVYVVNGSAFSSPEERDAVIALQGLVAKVSPQIFVPSSSLDSAYIEEIKKSGSEILYINREGSTPVLQTLIEKFGSFIKDNGYILYRSEGDGINIATNLATLTGFLPVPVELEEAAINAGLTKKEDISDDSYNLMYQWNFFEKHKSAFNKAAVCHQSPDAQGLRDLAIQQGFYMFYTSERKTDEQIFKKRVLDYFGPNTHIFGWTDTEVAFVDSISANGNMISPADHCHNNSLFSSLDCTIPSQTAVTETYTDPKKHYVALVMSDGDNIQWIQNGFREYFEKISRENDFPLTWSVSPMLSDLSPVTLKTVYEKAGTENYFISGVSGAGYIHPTQYPKNALARFTDITAAAMAECGLTYVQILDSTPENALDEAKLTKALEYYARYDNIEGGVLCLDPSRYEGGKGKVFFACGKPFISNRLSLWHPSGEMAQVTTEWLDEQAEIVNSYPADISSINGYSVINIHPWTISIESLNYFVNQLDSDVVTVTLDELIQMIKTNVPAETAEITIN